ncbi:MAG TPA: hypothetical protein VKZ86_05545 [Cyclobacteriaceae bacterium]|nr:hypothetical protein [Cyclobacteriaceae bacterium]
MLRYLLSFLLIIAVHGLVAQSTAELDSRNGFKDIRLGTRADSVKGARLRKEFTIRDNVYPSQTYVVDHPDYASIGDVKVRSVELGAYRNLIETITLITEKDPRLMRALENLFGAATYDARNNRYFWRGESIILTYQSHAKKDLLLEYRSLLIPHMMSEDRRGKIDKIADDF